MHFPIVWCAVYIHFVAYLCPHPSPDLVAGVLYEFSVATLATGDQSVEFSAPVVRFTIDCTISK
jgi:hypothetical protein